MGSITSADGFPCATRPIMTVCCLLDTFDVNDASVSAGEKVATQRTGRDGHRVSRRNGKVAGPIGLLPNLPVVESDGDLRLANSCHVDDVSDEGLGF